MKTESDRECEDFLLGARHFGGASYLCQEKSARLESRAQLARISHRGRCIGESNLEKLFCEERLGQTSKDSPMRTNCSSDLFGFAPVEGRRVEAAFDGGSIGSDGTSCGRTRKSWTCRRRVVGKAEWTQGEANPRFVVTSLDPQYADARTLYEDFYCARRDGEPHQGMPARSLRRPNLRRHYTGKPAPPVVRLDGLRAARRLAPHRARGDQARQCHLRLHRLKLFKIGALVRVSVRRVKIAIASRHPWQRDWAIAHAALGAAR